MLEQTFYMAADWVICHPPSLLHR